MIITVHFSHWGRFREKGMKRNKFIVRDEMHGERHGACSETRTLREEGV